MKRLLTTTLLVFYATHLFGQANFSVEGKTVKTGHIVKTYNFYYQAQDTVSLFFSDSSVTLTNSTQTIKKKISYSRTDKTPNTIIYYFRKTGEDSISKHFNGNKLSRIYETKFDKHNRKVYYALKDFSANSGNDRGFEWFYEYRDSSIKTGKIEIQTVFVDDAYGDKRFHFRVLNEYDSKNRKIKEIRESKTNDPMAQTIDYTYGENDSVIETRVRTFGFDNTFSNRSGQENTPCNKEIEKEFVVSNFRDYELIIEKLLLDNKKILTTEECENFICSYVSPDKRMKITIRKVKPYWEGGRNASVIVTKSYL